MVLTRDEARSVLTKLLSYATVDEVEASLSGGRGGNLRFARSAPTTNGDIVTASLSVSAVIGRKVGSASTTDLGEEGLRDVMKRAERFARLAPESPEYMARLGPQNYLDVAGWDDATAEGSPAGRAAIAADAITRASAKGLEAAGFLEDGSSFTALANSRGLFAYHRSTGARYKLTVRHADGNGSGWSASESFRSGAIDGAAVTTRAIEKALASRDPIELEPGRYPVVLEPSAVGELLKLLWWNLGRRAADEGRSYFSNGEKGTKIGEKVFDERVTIYSDPAHPQVPSTPWGEDGLPLARRLWIERGILKNLAVERFWAGEKGIDPIPSGSNLIMEGGGSSIEEMIAATERGLLVTSFWYIRTVDPRTILHTGLTRDGLFLIEKGKITRPVVNFRWNESPAAILNRIEMIGPAERIVTREGNAPMLVPPLRLSGFDFTSVSPST